MTKASVSLNFEEALDTLSEVVDIFQLDEWAVKSAIIRAINRTLITIRKTLSQKITAQTGVKNRIIKGRFRKFGANRNFMRGRLSFLAAGVPASILNYRMLKKKGGVKVLNVHYKSAFVRTPRKRKRGKIREMIFERVGPQRLPLFERRIKIIDKASAVFSVSEEEVYSRFIRYLEQELIFKAKAFKK
jgi:hypothetical protein